MSLGLVKLPFQVAYFKYKRRTCGNVRPKFINFITTFRCNSRCNMCGIWYKYSSQPEKLKDELSLSQIRDFLLRNKGYLKSLGHIGLTGGEAFLREDIVEIIRSIREILPQVKTGIQTNALADNTKDKVEEIVKFYHEFSLSVSIDGVRDTHDNVRGVKGAFDKAVELVKYAKRLGINISCGMTISRQNYREIKQVKKIVEDMGAAFSCFLPEQAEYFNNINSNHGLDDEMKKEVCRSFQELFKYNYYMDSLCSLISENKKRHLPCYSGYTSLVIDPYGFVKPCILREDSFGNIKDEPLSDMLSSSQARNLRKGLRNCFCWCQCEVSASAVTDPMDVIGWFMFNCKDRQGFLRELRHKLSYI